MALPLYPVALDANEALRLALSKGVRVARQSEAVKVAGKGVRFVTEAVGPKFATQKAAEEAHAGLLEPNQTRSANAEDRFYRLQTLIGSVTDQRLPPAKEKHKNGRRWEARQPQAAPVWQLFISYWKIETSEAPLDASQARTLRKKKADAAPDKQTLKRLTEQKLAPTLPQKALDYGLFDFIPPDDPSIVIADE